MGTYDDFWGKAGPGLLDFGLGMYSKDAAQKEAAKRLAAARGPLYDQAMSGASGMLSQAGSMNPDQFAADRFKANQALVQPVQDRDLDSFMRMLRAKGQLGMANYNPGVEGITPNGTAMNPQLAAFFAARNAATAKAANASMQQGQDYLDNLVRRSGMLSGQAANVQRSGLEGERTQPSRAAGNAELARGALKVLGDSGVLKDVFKSAPGMIGSGIDWLGNTISGWWNPAPQKMTGDFGSNDFGTGDSFNFA